MEQIVELWHQHRLIYVRHTGEISRAGAIDFLESMQQIAAVAEDYSYITDQRHLEVGGFAVNDIDWLIQEVAKRRIGVQRAKHALLVTTPLAFGQARMFELKSKGITRQEICVFTDWIECLRWLRIDEALPDPDLREPME